LASPQEVARLPRIFEEILEGSMNELDS
jgi:hypothetical protein